MNCLCFKREATKRARRKLKSFSTIPPRKKISKDELEANRQDEKVEAIKVCKDNYKKMMNEMYLTLDTKRKIWTFKPGCTFGL